MGNRSRVVHLGYLDTLLLHLSHCCKLCVLFEWVLSLVLSLVLCLVLCLVLGEDSLHLIIVILICVICDNVYTSFLSNKINETIVLYITPRYD